MNPPHRILHHAEACAWLARQGVMTGCSLITSLPDLSEFPQMSVGQWSTWFVRAAGSVLAACPADGLTIFYQSDIQRDGVWIDKGFLCQSAALAAGHALLAHKIVCRAPVGQTTYARPGYSHLLVFGRDARLDVAKSQPDILPSAGAVTWTRGMGVEACRAACRMVLNLTSSHTIVDPFCGEGAVLAVANALGLHAIGVDLRQRCVRKARALTYSLEVAP